MSRWELFSEVMKQLLVMERQRLSLAASSGCSSKRRVHVRVPTGLAGGHSYETEQS